jgi:hypothetical protein
VFFFEKVRENGFSGRFRAKVPDLRHRHTGPVLWNTDFFQRLHHGEEDTEVLVCQGEYQQQIILLLFTFVLKIQIGEPPYWIKNNNNDDDEQCILSDDLHRTYI